MLTVAAGIAVAGSVVGWWVHQTVLETDTFMAAVTPAVESESVQAVVADRLGDEIVEALDLENRVTNLLSTASSGVRAALADALDLNATQAARLDRIDFGLQAIAAPLAAGVEARIRDAVAEFVASPRASELLLNLIETAHERTVLLLRDELDQLPSIVIEDGEVRLNLVPMAAEALRSVINAGVGVVGIDREIPPFESADEAEQAIERLADALGRDLRPDFGQVSLMSEAQLAEAQRLVQAFDRLVWVLLLIAVILGGLAVAFAPSIPAGLLRMGVAVAVAVAVGWLAIGALTAALAGVAGTPEGQTALADLTSAVVRTLEPLAAALAIIGIATAIAALAVGRGWIGTAARDTAAS